jgi:hypothetical protein
MAEYLLAGAALAVVIAYSIARTALRDRDAAIQKANEEKEKLARQWKQMNRERERQHEEWSEIGKTRQRLEAMRSQAEREFEQERTRLESIRLQTSRDHEAVRVLASEKAQGFPWLADAYSRYFYLQDMREAHYLEHKPHPAAKAAEVVRKMAHKRRLAERLYRVLRYKLEYYERLFPWLVDFQGEDIDDLIVQLLGSREKESQRLAEPDDPARKWLTEAEYQKLPRTERHQLALDRYWQKKKSKWEIGRDYERYVGYLYEQRGYSVHYQGIVEGLEDLGRDLIACMGDSVEIVQCKCWASHKLIHEKHIFQLFGTTVEYWLEQRQEDEERLQPWLLPELLHRSNVQGTFITSTKLSERAGEYARVLGIGVQEWFPLQPYPSVKCNVSRRTDEKIYHLPFDQQYDRTLVEEERNECYVATVKEAEDLGYRRAFRWSGHSKD